MGAPTGGPFYNQVFNLAPQILKLASQSRSGGNRCSLAGLEGSPSLCPPPFVSHCAGTSEGSESAGDVFGACDTMLANSGLVHSVTGNARGPPTDTLTRFSPLVGGSAISQLRLSSSTQPTSVGHMEGLWHQFRTAAIPEEAINLILA